MGIDIYARWKGQTKEEEEAQIVGFSPVHGHVGYLREAYHGEPYATRFLCREAFASETGIAVIPAAVLRKRLRMTVQLAEQREREVYRQTDKSVIAAFQASFVAFVELCELKEKQTGEPVEIIASY